MRADSDGRRRPFLTGWRVAALNVLSASAVVTSLSSALVGSQATQVVLVDQAPSPAVVVLRDAPLRLPWPAAGATAYVDLVSGSAGAAAVGVTAPGAAASAQVAGCAAAWTVDGACRTGAWQLDAGRLQVEPGRVTHLRLTADALQPARASIVVARGTAALETVLTSG